MTRFLQRAAHSWLAWGLIVFAALLSFSSPSETSVGFSEPKSEIKAAVSLSDFGARQLINLFVFFFAAVH
jgi:hypothetical protein